MNTNTTNTSNTTDKDTTTVFVFDGNELPGSSELVDGKYHIHGRQRAASKYLSRVALGPGQYDIRHNTYGRPYVVYTSNQEAEENRGVIEFNVSHHESVVVFAKSSKRVGIDLVGPTHDQTQLVNEMWDQVLSSKEIDYYMNNNNNNENKNKERYFMQIWCVKEAYLKYRGTGLSQPGLDLRDIQVNMERKRVNDAEWTFVDIGQIGPEADGSNTTQPIACVLVQKSISKVCVERVRYGPAHNEQNK